MSADRPRTWTSGRLALVAGVGALLVVAVAAAAVWFVFFSSSAPGGATIGQAAGVLESPSSAASAGTGTGTDQRGSRCIQRRRHRGRRVRHVDGGHIGRVVRRLHERLGGLPGERGPPEHRRCRGDRPHAGCRRPAHDRRHDAAERDHLGRPHDDPQQPGPARPRDPALAGDRQLPDRDLRAAPSPSTSAASLRTARPSPSTPPAISRSTAPPRSSPSRSRRRS